jgi:site-specific DNA-methyltransferase (adenine-specific)
MDDLFNTLKPKIATSVTLLLGECLERMKEIPDGSVDMVMADLPYGTTACKWDSVIPFEPLWEAYRRVTKKNAAIVLTASQPFTSALVMSNPTMFKYCWVWEKSKGSNFQHSKYQPLKVHEDLVVFSSSAAAQGTKNPMSYFPQKVAGKEYKGFNNPIGAIGTMSKGNLVATSEVKGAERYPRSVYYQATAENEGKFHPTQKPVALMEYLIRTYTNPGELVLDNTMGSGTTGVACINTGRNFIGIERDEGYFKIAQARCGITTE